MAIRSCAQAQLCGETLKITLSPVLLDDHVHDLVLNYHVTAMAHLGKTRWGAWNYSQESDGTLGLRKWDRVREEEGEVWMCGRRKGERPILKSCTNKSASLV